MDAVEFLKERKRMCELNYDRETECKSCEAFQPNDERHKCKALMIKDFKLTTNDDFKQAVEFVESWSKKHPKKTRFQDFIERYPNAKVDKSFFEAVCCERLGYVDKCPFNYDAGACKDCWNEPLE